MAIGLYSMIELKHVCKSYISQTKPVDVLKDIHLEINAGELVAIMGPSGSGKSTLMNILGLLDQPTGGQYIFEQKNIESFDHEELARFRNQYIGFVFQSFMLLPRMTVLQNICLPLLYQSPPDLNSAKALQILKKMNLQHLSDRKPNELSGGQQQRIAIARALITNPKIILADEPTGALDSTTGQEIMQLLCELHQNDNRTIIIVTHDIKIAQQCQKIIQLNDGVIVNVH